MLYAQDSIGSEPAQVIFPTASLGFPRSQTELGLQPREA